MIIPRHTIDSYLKKKRLASMPKLLMHIQTKRGAASFGRFIRDDLHKPYPLDEVGLLHGSSTKGRKITPRYTTDEKGKRAAVAYVYATSDPHYAIFLALLRLKNARAGVESTDRKTHLTIDLDFVNGPSKLLPGYVHILPRKQFHKTSNSEYVCDHDVPILYSIEVVPSDLSVPIEVTTGS